MSEISRALDRSRREAGGAPEKRRTEPRPVVTASSTAFGLDHDTAEQYLSLASTISLTLSEDGPKMLLFAGSVPGEGTSTIAREFAATLAARADADTLLIDANLRSPSVHQAFRVERDPGLSEHVLGDASVVDCLRSTGMQRLTVLPAGRPVVAPPRVSSDPRMKELLLSLRARFQWTIVDAPPLLAYPEGVHLARHCDGAILLIRAGHTRRQLPRQAVGLLEEAGARVLGTVLNRRRYYIPAFIYDRI